MTTFLYSHNKDELISHGQEISKSDPKMAEKWFLGAIQVDGKSGAGYVAYANFLARQGDTSRAFRLLNNASGY